MRPHVLPMIELGALLLFGVALVALTVAFMAILKAVFWLVLMPFRVVFWAVGAILFVPVFLVKTLFGGLMALLAVPLVLLGLLAAFIAMVFGVLIPAIPLILLVALLWYLVRPEPNESLIPHP